MSSGRADRPLSDLGDAADVQAALRRVTAIAAAAEPPEAVFAAVTVEGSALLGGVLLSLARYEGGGSEAEILAETGGHVKVGAWFPGTNPLGITYQLWKTGRPQRIDDFAAVAGSEHVLRLDVRACVAVPVVVDGALWGCLAAASRTGPLPSSTEDRLTMLGEIVAVAVVSAAARTSLRVLADEQAALLRVAGVVAQGAAEAVIFNAVAVEAASLIHDEPTTLVRYEGKRTFTVLAAPHGPLGPGTRFTVPVDDAGGLDEMLRTHRPARRDNHGSIADRSFAAQQFAVGSSVSVPIVVQGRLWGALGAVTDGGRRLPAETEGRLAKFTELVGSALADVEARTALERFGEEQAALRRAAELAASGVPFPAVLRAIVEEASLLLLDAVVIVGQYGPSGTWRRVEVAVNPAGDSAVPAGSPDEDVVAREVLASGRPFSVEGGECLAAGSVADVRLRLSQGVPVRVDGEVWGAVVTVAGRRPLPTEAENLLTQFASVAATAVSGALSRDSLGRLAREQAVRRVAELIARGASLEEVFDAVATEASSILGGVMSGVFRYDPDGFATVVAECRSAMPVGIRIPLDPTAVRQRRGAIRLATLGNHTQAPTGPDDAVGAVVAVPISVEGQVWGGLGTSTRGKPLSADAEDRLSEFAELAAAAVANAENRVKLRASRARLVATADETRQRLQRDVHDGAQQRLVQVVLILRLGLDMAARGEGPIELMREALQEAERAMVELRNLVHGILPASLSRGGLRSGIESLIDGLSVPVDLDVTALPKQRLPTDLEVTVYFIVAEALTNVVKHAGATRARVTVAADADVLTVEVSDDGRGGADLNGTGLTGLTDRVDAMNGTLLLTSPLRRGTTLEVKLPRSRSMQ